MTATAPAEPRPREAARAAAQRRFTAWQPVAWLSAMHLSGAWPWGPRRWRAVLVAASLPAVLAACATRVTMPALPDSHPAHPAAAAAEPIQPSDLLDRAAPVPAVEPAVTEGHDHHAHGMAESAPPGQPADEPAAEEHEHHHDPDPPPPGPAG